MLSKNKKRQKSVYSEFMKEYLSVQHKKYKALCEQGNNTDACYYLAMFYDTVKTSGKNSGLAGNYYKIGCETNKSGLACLKVGNFYREGLEGFQMDAEKAAQAFDRSCAYGNGEGCYYSGLAFTPWNGGELARWRVAEKRFMQGCALNHLQSCDALSAVYRRGEVSPEKKMIFAKSYGSFVELLFSQHNLREEDEGKLNLLLLLKDRDKLAKQCRKVTGIQENPEMHNEFQKNYMTDSEFIPKIPAGDGINLSFGCLNRRIQNPELCHRMAEWMMLRHTDIGCLMHDQSCKLGSEQSCLKLGSILLQGFPVYPKDHDGAAEAFENACKLGSAQGCYQAGVMRASSSGELQCQKRNTSAEFLFIKGCSLNHEQSCVQLSALYRQNNRNGSYVDENNQSLLQTLPWTNRFQVHSADKKTCNLGKFEECAKLSEFCKQKMGHSAKDSSYFFKL